MADEHFKNRYRETAKLRQAIRPLFEQLVKDMVTDGKNITLVMPDEDVANGLRQDMQYLQKSVESLGDAIIENKPPKIDFTRVEQTIDNLIQATDYNSREISGLRKAQLQIEGLQSLREIMARTLQKLNNQDGQLTDPDDPTDYVNVRLTDGKDFYEAIRRAIAGVSAAAGTPTFLAADGVTPARPILTSDGKVPTTATLVADQITIAASGTFVNQPGQTIAVSGVITSISGTQNSHIDNFPTVQTVNVLNMPGISLAPTTSGGGDHKFIDNWPTTISVISISGVQHAVIDNFPSVQSVIAQGITTISGTVMNTPGVPIAVSGTMISSSGTLNAHIDNYPTVHAVQPQVKQDIAGRQEIVAVSGTSQLNIGNFPTTFSVISVSGSEHVVIDNFPTVQKEDLAYLAGTPIVNAGVPGALAIGGSAATNVAIGTNPTNQGAQAISAENAAVTATRMVQLVADLTGKLIVLPYANPENFVSGAITSAMTATTSTSLLAAPAAGLRNYITQITVSNSHASVGTDILIQDGSGGTTLFVIPAAAAFGGATLTFPTPLRQPTTATAIFVQNVTTGSNTKVSANGYKGI